MAETVGEDSRPELRSRREESEIERYFEESLITCALPSRFPGISGSEHEVWKIGDRVLKATMPGEFGRLWGPRRFATPAEYIQRIELARTIFEVPWELLGVVREGRSLRVVTSQPCFSAKGAEPGNVLMTEAGPIPIDLILQHPDEETLKIAGLGEV